MGMGTCFTDSLYCSCDACTQARDFTNIEFVNLVMGMGTLSKDRGYQPSQEWIDALFR